MIENTFKPINKASDHYLSRRYFATETLLTVDHLLTQFMNSSKEKSTSKASENSMITCWQKERAKNCIIRRITFDNPYANDYLTHIIGTHREVIIMHHPANSTHYNSQKVMHRNFIAR